MAVTYKKLFHLLIDREMSPAELAEQAGFSANILTRLRRCLLYTSYGAAGRLYTVFTISEAVRL